MNQRLLTLLMVITALLIAVLPGNAEDEKKVTITGNDQMKYDVTAIEAIAGQKVTITITNSGQLPKTAMAHNIVLLKPGTDVTAFAMAGMSQAATDYIAPDQANKVIIKTKFLGPGESDTISFTAPAAGSYDYICTFPGHVMAGMRGVLTVK